MGREKQIEANRRNARNSTKPALDFREKRASQNAFPRGLTSRSQAHRSSTRSKSPPVKSRATPRIGSQSSWPATPPRRSSNWRA
jgi:hypothetical protein